VTVAGVKGLVLLAVVTEEEAAVREDPIDIEDHQSNPLGTLQKVRGEGRGGGF